MSDIEALRASVEAARAKKIEIPEADREKAKLLAELAAEAERLKEEEFARLTFVMNDAHFAARQKLGPDAILDSTVIPGVGAFVVRAPSKEERRKLNDKAGKDGFEVGTINLVMAVTLFPSQEEMRTAVERTPYIVDTIVTMAMKAGGMQLEADRRKSG